MSTRVRKRRVSTALCAGILTWAATAAPIASAYSLWSTQTTQPETGEIHFARQTSKLGELKVRNLLLVGPMQWLVPFNNNGEKLPNGCAVLNAPADAAMRANENVDGCPIELSAGELSMFVVDGGHHQGYQVATISRGGELSMSADIALQIGDSPPVRAPFYATTGVAKLAPELRSRADDIVRRMPWMKAAPGELRGRLGDFDGNGWIDGTVIALGTLPPQSPIHPGAPYLLIRHFETDLPVDGVLSGDVKALRTNAR